MEEVADKVEGLVDVYNLEREILKVNRSRGEPKGFGYEHPGGFGDFV